MVVEADLAVEADAFAAALAARVADEPQLRWQGMPSDADSRTAYAALGAGGWIGLHWPERLGGGGRSPLDTVSCEERFGYHWLPLSGYLLSVKTIGNALLRFADQALQERLLPEIAAGRLLFCQGFSEPDAGSDLAALRTTALDAGDRFVVSGRKLWTSSADVADWIYLAGPDRPGAAPPRALGARRAARLPRHHGDDARDARRRHDRRGRARGGRGPARPARRRARRRLGGADGHARPRAGDEREGRRRAVAARPARRARRDARRARATAAAARRGGGGPAAAPRDCSPRGGRRASRARWRSWRSRR
jgi:Acyl-CoA dehydrogenase, N-terminal domain/Acyl-CoA dehydrogenase, middle domain